MSLRRASMSSSGPMQIAFDRFLRADDMFHRGDELGRQTAVGHQHQSDHSLTSICHWRPGRPVCSSIVSLGGEARSRCRTFGENPAAAQPFRHLDRRGDRAVSPAGAAERDGEIGFAGGPVARECRSMRSASIRSIAPAPGRVLREIVADRVVERRSAARSSSTQCGLARKRMSNTRSAVRDTPRAKPNEAMVSTGWSASPP